MANCVRIGRIYVYCSLCRVIIDYLKRLARDFLIWWRCKLRCGFTCLEELQEPCISSRVKPHHMFGRTSELCFLIEDLFCLFFFFLIGGHNCISWWFVTICMLFFVGFCEFVYLSNYSYIGWAFLISFIIVISRLTFVLWE